MAMRVVLLLLLSACQRPPIAVELAVHWPGADVVAVEKQAVEPIERVMGGLPRLVTTSAESRAEWGRLRLVFAASTDVLVARAAIIDKLDSVALPKDATVELEPLSAQAPIRFAVAGSDYAAVEDLCRKLLTMPGVSQVSLCGPGRQRTELAVDTAKLDAASIGLVDIGASLRRLPPATTDGFVIRGTTASVDSLGAAVVSTANGAPVRLSDVAKISTVAEPSGCVALHDGVDVWSGTIRVRPDGNRALIRAAMSRLGTTSKVTVLDDATAGYTLRAPLGHAHDLAVAIDAAARAPNIHDVTVEVGDGDIPHSPDVRVFVAAERRELSALVMRLRKIPSVALVDAEGMHTMTMAGPDRDVLRRLARPLADHKRFVSEGIGEATSVDFHIDPAMAQKLGVAVEDVEATLAYVRGRAFLTDVVLQPREGIAGLSVAGANHNRVPLSALMHAERVSHPVSLLRENGKPAIRIRWLDGDAPKLPSLPPGVTAR